MLRPPLVYLECGKGELEGTEFSTISDLCMVIFLGQICPVVQKWFGQSEIQRGYLDSLVASTGGFSVVFLKILQMKK